MSAVARLFALTGGVVLVAAILITCLSVAGREIDAWASGWIADSWPGLATWLRAHVGAIDGDYELVEAGVAFAIFSFLPLCQLTSGHARVDILASRFPPRLDRLLRAIIECVFALVLVLIAWRLALGMIAKRGYLETTFQLQFPVWWAYAASLVPAVLAGITGLYTASIRVLECWTGHILLEEEPEVDH